RRRGLHHLLDYRWRKRLLYAKGPVDMLDHHQACNIGHLPWPRMLCNRLELTGMLSFDPGADKFHNQARLFVASALCIIGKRPLVHENGDSEIQIRVVYVPVRPAPHVGACMIKTPIWLVPVFEIPDEAH